MRRIIPLLIFISLFSSNAFAAVSGGAPYTDAQAQSATGWTDDGTAVRLTTITDNVGIGTLTPTQRLSLGNDSVLEIGTTNGGSGASGLRVWRAGDPTLSLDYGSIWVKNDGEVVASQETLHIDGRNIAFSGGDTTNRMVLNSSGNVGIGTTTPMGGLAVMRGNVGIGTWAPSDALEVTGNISSKSGYKIYNGASSDSVGIQVGAASGILDLSGFTGINLRSSAAGIASQTVRMYVDGTSGNIGIGSAAPGQLLDVQGVLRTASGSVTAPAHVIGSGVNNDTGAYSSGTDIINFANAGVETLRLTADGNIGVGTPAPRQKLEVQGNSYFSGNVGLAITSPSVILDVLGQMNINNPGITALTGATGTPSTDLDANTTAWHDDVYPSSSGSANTSRRDAAATSIYMQKDWGASTTRIVTRFVTYAGSDSGYCGGAGQPTVTIKLQGSSNGSTFVDLFTTSVTDTATSNIVDKTVVDGINVSTAYRYHRILISHDASARDMYVSEALFYVSGYSVVADTGGNVGIGTNIPGSSLAIGSTSQFKVNSSGAISASTGITTSGGYTQSGTTANTFTGTPTFSNATHSALFSGGNVGIGSATPGVLLDISGTFRSTASNNIGWSPQNASNQACNTTCTVGACVAGIDTTTTAFLLCTDATADSCLCAGQ